MRAGLDSKAAPDRRAWRAGFAVCLVVVTVGTLLPGDAMPPNMGVDDKSQHLISYAVLALTACLSLRSWPAMGLAAGLLVMHGGLIELLQSFVPGRWPEGADVLADGLGVALGVGAFAAVAFLRRRDRPI